MKLRGSLLPRSAKTRNPAKRWWLDLEIVDDEVVVPAGTNERDLSLEADTSGRKSPVGYYHAADNPPPDAKTPVSANHKAAIERASYVETVDQALDRVARGEVAPAHYAPAPLIQTVDVTDEHAG